MFLRKLALSVGRLDFWNLPKEMTQFQIAVHRAASEIEPIGEDRADLRMAIHTMALIHAQRTKPMTSDEMGKLVESLLSYLPVHLATDDVKTTPDEAARAGKAAFAVIGK